MNNNDNKPDNSAIYAITVAAITLVVMLALGQDDTQVYARRMHWLAALFYNIGGDNLLAVVSSIFAGGLTWAFTKKH